MLGENSTSQRAARSPSPSHMKGSGGEYPGQQGVPVQLSYAHMEKDQARMALVRAHDQLSRQFPEVCPLDTPDSRPLRGQQREQDDTEHTRQARTNRAP